MVFSSVYWELKLVVVPYQADRRSERHRLVGEADQAIEHMRDIMPLATAEAGYVPLLILEGDWASARRILLSLGAHDSPNRLIVAGLLGPLAREQGESDLAWEQVRGAFPLGPDTPPGDVPYYAMGLQRLAARLALDGGDLATAQVWLRAHDHWVDWSGAVPDQADALLSWAAYHRAAGDPDRAYLLATEALTRATNPRQPLALLAAHRLLGQLDSAAGRRAEAEEHLLSALSLAEVCAAPYERALTQLAQAELHLAEGDLLGTRGHLDAACPTLARLGASRALERAETLVARLDPIVPMRGLSDPGRAPAGRTTQDYPPGDASPHRHDC
jgi:tetratricopeptide (TPR) repeat protein